MDIHYLDHGTPSDDVVRIVQERTRQLDALLAQRRGCPVSPMSLDVTLYYDVRPDTYVAVLILHIGDRAVTASGCADIKWAALHRAFEALLATLGCAGDAATGQAHPSAERGVADVPNESALVGR